MSRLKQNLLRNNFHILFLLIILINTNYIVITVNGVTEPSKQQQQIEERSATEYELADEVQKCNKIRNDRGEWIKVGIKNWFI